jgi:hypothetical protein
LINKLNNTVNNAQLYLPPAASTRNENKKISNAIKNFPDIKVLSTLIDSTKITKRRKKRLNHPPYILPE